MQERWGNMHNNNGACKVIKVKNQQSKMDWLTVGFVPTKKCAVANRPIAQFTSEYK